MEEEEDKDDKKEKVEKQHKAAEESKQGEISTSRVQAETSKTIDNKGSQNQGSEVFQMSSEFKVLDIQAQNENGMNDGKENITQKSDTAANAGESSLTNADHQESLSLTDRAVLEDEHSINTVAETLEGGGINTKAFSSDKHNENFKEPVYQNLPVQLHQPQHPEESLLLTESLSPQAPEGLATETTEQQEKQTKTVLKPCASPKKQLKQTKSGDITSSESKQDDSQSVQRQSQPSKGQKSVQVLKQTGKGSQQKEVKEKGKKQGLQSTSEADKMQLRKGFGEQRKTQSDQKFKPEEKQTIEAKDGKKQSLSQKEQKLVSKPTETRKTDKKEQKFPVVQKQLQNLPSKKPSVYRKEQTLSSPKKNVPSQAILKQKQSNPLKKVQQKGGNANTTKNNESKGITQQPIEDCRLVEKNQQNPTLPQSTMVHPSVELQETMSEESSGSLLKSEKECEKELLKEYKKQEVDQIQETNKLSDKKLQQEKKNEIKKQKQQNEVNQLLKQPKKESLQSSEYENKTPQKSGESIKAPMSQKTEEESSAPVVIRKQASKVTKQIDASTQQNKEIDAMQQQIKVDKNSSKQKCLKEGKEAGKPNRKQSVTMNKNSTKENSSEDIIHSIRRQYQQLRKEESMKQRLIDQLPRPHHQPLKKEEKVQQEQKPEAKSDADKVRGKENLNQLAKKKSEEYEDDKGMGCGGMQGSSCPIYFGVRSYLHHFYDTAPVKNPQLYEDYTDEDDFEYAVDPVKSRGCRTCCQGFWFRAGLWGGINLILVGVITFLVGYLTPQREIIVGQQGDLEILDRSAIIFNHRLELCRLAGLAVFCCGGMVLFVVLFISTLLHVRGHYNNESMCCAENIYYEGYATAPIVEPFIVAQDLAVPSTPGIKIPIIEEIKSVQPTIWPEIGTVRQGSRVGQMP